VLRRILSEHRLPLVVVIAGLLANAAGYLVVVRPLAARVAGVEGQRERADRALKTAETDLASARAVVAGFDRARADLDRFYRAVLPADLNAASRMAYLRLAQMAQEHRLRYQNRSFAPGHLRDSGFDTLRVVMDLEGSYEEIRRLVFGIESAPEFLVIDRVALGTGRDPAGPLALTLELSTFFRAATHEP